MAMHVSTSSYPLNHASGRDSLIGLLGGLNVESQAYAKEMVVSYAPLPRIVQEGMHMQIIHRLGGGRRTIDWPELRGSRREGTRDSAEAPDGFQKECPLKPFSPAATLPLTPTLMA